MTALDKFVSRADDIGVGATEQDIQSFRERTGLAPPGVFAEFLRRAGWASLGANEYFGLGSDVPRHLDLMAIVPEERVSFGPGLRPDLLPIRGDGGGGLFALDTSRTDGDEAPVVLVPHDDRGANTQTVAATYSQWLLQEIISE